LGDAGLTLPIEEQQRLAASFIRLPGHSFPSAGAASLSAPSQALEDAPTAGLRQRLRDCQRKIQEYLKAFPWLGRIRHTIDPPAYEQEYARLKDEEARLIQELVRRGESPPRVELPREKAREVHSPAAEVLPSSESAGVEFTHSEDYASVVMPDGQKFALTRDQGDVIKMLHEAWISGNPWVSKKRILEMLKRETSRLQDIFRSTPGAWKALIKSGRRGVYRLNLPDHPVSHT
jgi:hypothetical protein